MTGGGGEWQIGRAKVTDGMQEIEMIHLTCTFLSFIKEKLKFLID